MKSRGNLKNGTDRDSLNPDKYNFLKKTNNFQINYVLFFKIRLLAADLIINKIIIKFFIKKHTMF